MDGPTEQVIVRDMDDYERYLSQVIGLTDDTVRRMTDDRDDLRADLGFSFDERAGLMEMAGRGLRQSLTGPTDAALTRYRAQRDSMASTLGSQLDVATSELDALRAISGIPSVLSPIIAPPPLDRPDARECGLDPLTGETVCTTDGATTWDWYCVHDLASDQKHCRQLTVGQASQLRQQGMNTYGPYAREIDCRRECLKEAIPPAVPPQAPLPPQGIPIPPAVPPQAPPGLPWPTPAPCPAPEIHLKCPECHKDIHVTVDVDQLPGYPGYPGARLRETDPTGIDPAVPFRTYDGQRGWKEQAIRWQGELLAEFFAAPTWYDYLRAYDHRKHLNNAVSVKDKPTED